MFVYTKKGALPIPLVHCGGWWGACELCGIVVCGASLTRGILFGLNSTFKHKIFTKTNTTHRGEARGNSEKYNVYLGYF